MGSHQCCCGPGAPGTCCNSGCECWEDVYAASVPFFDMGGSEACDCCGGCLDGTCCHEVTDFVCTTPADPTIHKCCSAFNWQVAGGAIKLYRTGELACKNVEFARNCTDPWSPITQSIEDTAPGCNVYETDYGIVGGDYVFPCPDVPHEDYIDVEFYRETFGGSCEDCPLGIPNFSIPIYEQEVREQVRVPVMARLTCCGDSGTSKGGCEPCPEDTLPGSGVAHYLVITPLAAIQYQWTEWTGTGTTGWQVFDRVFTPPTLTFVRKLSCSSTPAGEWRFAGTGPFDPCGSMFGWSGICPCDEREPALCVTDCATQEGSLCNCDWNDDLPPGCQADVECPSCAGQEDPTFNDLTMAAST